MKVGEWQTIQERENALIVSELLKASKDASYAMRIVSRLVSDRPELCVKSAVFGAMPYREYLETDHWRLKAEGAKDRASNRCQLCNSNNNLQAHHRTYERRGCESHNDLTVLCDECHKKFHNITDDEV